MILNQIKYETVKVNTDDCICPGIAKTEMGETFIISARTPESKGMCCQAFSALTPMRLAMSYTDKMDWESKDFFDIVCHHGFVTYRLSRVMEN